MFLLFEFLLLGLVFLHLSTPVYTLLVLMWKFGFCFMDFFSTMLFYDLLVCVFTQIPYLTFLFFVCALAPHYYYLCVCDMWKLKQKKVYAVLNVLPLFCVISSQWKQMMCRPSKKSWRRSNTRWTICSRAWTVWRRITARSQVHHIPLMTEQKSPSTKHAHSIMAYQKRACYTARPVDTCHKNNKL